MNNQEFNIDNLLLTNPVFENIFEDSKYNYVENLITKAQFPSHSQHKAIRYSFLLFNNELSKIDSTWSDRVVLFEKVYYLLRAIDIENNNDSFDEIWGIENIKTKPLYYFYLAATGLLSENNIKVQIDLREYSLKPTINESWESKILNQIFDCLTLLIRKESLNDIQYSLDQIEILKREQVKYEEAYLNNLPNRAQTNKAINLVGYYHLCKILTETASYLIQGYNYKENLQKIIQRHTRYAYDSFENLPRIQSLCSIIFLVCNRLYSNCIWTQTIGLSTNIQKLCETLNKKNFVDLMPSQQSAIKNHFLDPASSATILQMPTSAGKTLLAEFAILQTKALIPNAKVIYLVPTRALTNQVVSDLRNDFVNIGLSIEKSTGANELDPSEDLFLNSKIDVLVATPEKFDLLIRKDHPVTHNISLIVVDEAHNINDRGRGARLELLLSILKRERPNLRYLLLTPFIPRRENGELVKEWLSGGKNAIPPILVDWKPSDKIFIGLKEFTHRFEASLIRNPYGWHIKDGKFDIEKLTLKSTTVKDKLFEFTAKHFGSGDKSTLFLCQGKGTCDKRAEMLYNTLNLPDKNSDVLDLVSRYIEEVIGEKTILSKVLKKGIAVHHAGLTDETKRLIEYLIKVKEINYICATTTVAQGINFPISTVYFDDTRKGAHDHLTVSEFRNIAGRAGRTLIDNVGKIIFPFNTKDNADKAKKYLSAESEEISSALVDLILASEEIINAFSDNENSSERGKLFSNNEALSSLTQYLIHLLNVSKENMYADELEDLFKDSLGYYMLDVEKRKKFIEICNTLYFHFKNRTSKGVLKYADKTGFSVPSVLSIMQSKSENPEIKNVESWKPENLFNPLDYSSMTEKINVIAHLKEVKLGTDSTASPFNPEVVAEILVEWVNGANISKLSKIHPFYKNKEENRINEFINYLTTATFKTSWGLSALEGIVKSNNDDIEDINSYIPSMVYYGVKNKEAIALRMLGVPRLVAENMAPNIFEKKEPKSYDDVRETIKNLSLEQWKSITPSSSSLNSNEWKKITNILLD
ncbi:hypothetical protein CFS9_39040 [Flavobacterium sp. CFS9]|uniref:DEAD/DEAH box helicase n=1 Tax=Flavobacterium sp. CFS9 TaxID=3143118 RepID=A0AAT9H6V2_9FLAO